MNIRRTILAALLFCAMLLTGALAEGVELSPDVNAFGGSAGLNPDDLSGVLYIPEGVTEIADEAFRGCVDLTGVPVIPGTVRKIGAYAFEGCTGLSGVLVLPVGMDVHSTAFLNCPGLTVIRGVALVMDEGGYDDPSFNQVAQRAASSYCEAHGIDFKIYQNDDGSAAVLSAVQDGYNVVILTGFAYADAAAEYQAQYPDVRFICLDFDIEAPLDNVYCATYRDDVAGFMAGYAAVRLGYRYLGFLGGMAIPSVMRYGYGFVQGADRAATELGVADRVAVDFGYANQFNPSEELEQRMETWYARGVETVFACGGGIFGSVGAAAMVSKEAGVGKPGPGMVIGVDVDQAAYIDGIFGNGMTLTCAIKSMDVTIDYALDCILENRWAEIGGKARVMGVVSAMPEENHVQLAPSTRFGDGFTRSDYASLVAKIHSGDYVVSDSTAAMPAVTITVNEAD